MKKAEVRTRLNAALSTLWINDSHLFHINSSERSICHKLALYLEDQFPGYDVDVEYNRMGSEEEYPPKIKGFRGEYVTPDIIVHKRDVQFTCNLLVIEAKMSESFQSTEFLNDKSEDIDKLGEYKLLIKYQNAFFLGFPGWRDSEKTDIFVERV
jgi:hypothetical protein